MFTVARKNLLAHKLRTLFTAVAVALGVGFMAGTFVLTDTVSASFDTIFTEVYAGVDAEVRGEAAFEASAFDGGEQRPQLDPALADQVRAVDGVAEAQPVVQSVGTVLGDDGRPLNQTGAPSFGGNWTGVPAIDVFTVEEGREPTGPTEMVIDQITADAGGFEVGDTVGVQTLRGAVDLDLVGIVKFGESGNLNGASFVLMETRAALDTLTLNGQVQTIAVIADEGVSEEQVVADLEAALPDGVEAITATQATEEAQEIFGSFVDTFRVVLSAFAAIALAAGSFLIYNTFGIIIGQRIRELALLRALGAARRQILGSVVVEAGLIGLVASVLGLVGGIALAVLLQALLATTGLGQAGTAPVVAPRTVVVALVVGVVVSIACAFVPAWRASRVAPLAAIREVAVDDTSRSWVRLGIGGALFLGGLVALVVGSQGSDTGAIVQTALGTVVVFAGVVVLGPYIVPTLAGAIGAPLRVFGIAGALGRDNARRNPKRSAGTAAALMLSVTLITFIAVFALSFGRSINAAVDEQFRGDLELRPVGFGFPSLSLDVVDDLEARPEVAAVTGVQRGTVELDGRTRPVYGVRYDAVEAVFDLGETDGDISSLGPDGVAVDRVTSEREGWDIGTELPVRYPDGTSDTLTVGAVYGSGNIVAENSDGHFLVSDQVFQERFPDILQLLSRIDVTAAEGVSPEALRPIVEEAAADYPSAVVRDVGEIKAENNRQLTFSLALFFALLGLALVIGSLGVAITVALSVFERTREIGLLRAVGTTRNQLRTSITSESIVLTLLGTVLGLVIGVAGGIAIVQTQSDTIETLRISVPPAFVIGVLLLALFIGVVASVFPAWRASRMDVLDAVTVE